MADRTTPDRWDDMLDEAEAMIWSLLDGNLDAADTARLESLLRQDKSVMARYLECVQLETELRGHFGAPKVKPPLPTTTSAPATATLPTAMPVLPPLDMNPLAGFGFMPPVG